MLLFLLLIASWQETIKIFLLFLSYGCPSSFPFFLYCRVLFSLIDTTLPPFFLVSLLIALFFSYLFVILSLLYLCLSLPAFVIHFFVPLLCTLNSSVHFVVLSLPSPASLSSITRSTRCINRIVHALFGGYE